MTLQLNVHLVILAGAVQTVSVLLSCHEHCCASFMPETLLTRSGAAMLSKIVRHFGGHCVEVGPLRSLCYTSTLCVALGAGEVGRSSSPSHTVLGIESQQDTKLTGTKPCHVGCLLDILIDLADSKASPGCYPDRICHADGVA